MLLEAENIPHLSSSVSVQHHQRLSVVFFFFSSFLHLSTVGQEEQMGLSPGDGGLLTG